MSPPIISVIIPAYNRAWSIKRAVDSVLAQTFADFELIVVDDGSTDDTPAILAEYGDRIQLLRQENRGVSAARNAGIVTAKGNYIALLDSDDEWYKDKLEKQIEFFEKNPSYKICQTVERWIRHGKFVNIPDVHKKLPDYIFQESLKKCMVTCSSVMMKRELLDEAGLFNESLFACEDYDLWLRISWKYPVGLIDKECLIRYGGHKDQLSSVSHGFDRYRIRAIMNVLDNCPLTAEQRTQAIDELSFKCRVYGEGCIKRERADEGNRFLRITEEY